MKDYGDLFRRLEKILDLILNLLSAYAGYRIAIFENGAALASTAGVGTVIAVVVICLLMVPFYGLSNLYRPMRVESHAYYIGKILSVNSILFCVTVAYLAIFRAEEHFYLFWLMMSFLISTLVLIVKKSLEMVIVHRIREKKINVKRIMLMTDSQTLTDEYLRQIHLNPQFGYHVIGYVGNVAIDSLPHLGPTADLDRLIKENKPDEVVLAFETVRRKLIMKYVSVCDDNCVKVLAVPAICGFFKTQRQIRQFGELPLLDIRSNPLENPVNRLIKRLTDILLSSLFLLLFSPVMLFAAIGVRLSSPGPILYRQVRIGKDGKEFTMYKFRSMVVNEDETAWTTDHDNRKTPFGNFIRKFSIDELPQFFNVLKGDMSIVGPRPEIPFYVEKFRKAVPLYMLKHSCRPGITGLAQIHGLRGDTSIVLRIEEDIHYIEHWSWWEDARIILLTPWRAINKHEKAPDEAPMLNKTVEEITEEESE